MLIVISVNQNILFFVINRGETKLEFILLLSLQSCLLTAAFFIQVSLGKHLRNNHS